MVWACEKFHIYLYGVDFELITDHKPLEVLYGSKSRPNARIERWVMRLMPYTFKVRYLPGNKNIADVLSRLVHGNEKPSKLTVSLNKQTEEYVRFVAKNAVPKAISVQEVERASKDDAELIEVRKCLKQASWDKSCVNYYPMRNEIAKIGYLVLRGTVQDSSFLRSFE